MDLSGKRDRRHEVRNPSEKDLRCFVHDREWLWHDTLLVDGLASAFTVADVQSRLSELKGIPSHITEVVIFEVEAEEEEEEDAFMDGDTSSVLSNGGGGDDDEESQAGKGRGRRRRRPVSVCLWKPVKPVRETRYLVTVAADRVVGEQQREEFGVTSPR